MSRRVQQDATGSHDEKKNDCRNPQQPMETFEYVSVCTEKKHTRKTPLVISRNSNMRPFLLAPFSPLSWSLEKAAYLDLKEFWVPYRTKKPYNILGSYLSEKALVPFKSKFLPVFHALTVCDTTSLSAGHRIDKIRNIDFLPFFFWK